VLPTWRRLRRHWWVAAEVQGVSWSTLDLDIVIEDREENYIALASALVNIDAWCLVPLGSIQRIRPDLELLRALTGTLMLRTLRPTRRHEGLRLRRWRRQLCHAGPRRSRDEPTAGQRAPSTT